MRVLVETADEPFRISSVMPASRPESDPDAFLVTRRLEPAFTA